MEDTNGSVPQHLKCPICLEIPQDKVFQCKFGHIFCEACYEKLVNKQCPQCRVDLPTTPIRSRVAEETLDSLKLELPCQFQSAGCERKLDRREIARHISSCKYDIQKFGKLRHVCSLFGFQNCSFKINRANTDETIAHFQSAHGMRSIKALLTEPFKLVYENCQDIFNSSQATIFTPLIFNQNWWGHGCVYIIVTRFNPHDKTLQFTPFYLIYREDCNVVKSTVHEPVLFSLGGSYGTLSSHRLLDCEGQTLHDFSYFSAPLGKWLNADNPGILYSILVLKLSAHNKPLPPQVRNGVEEIIKYGPGDIVHSPSTNQGSSIIIRQAFSAATPQNWDKFRWIASQNFKNCKNRFSPALTSVPANKMLICRTIINEKWLAGYIIIDNKMNWKSPATFLSPNLLTRTELITLEKNFEVLYTPPNSFEWAAWADLKDKEAIPVHEEEMDLLICASNNFPGDISFIGTVEKDMKIDVMSVYALVLSEKGKDIAKSPQPF